MSIDRTVGVLLPLVLIVVLCPPAPAAQREIGAELLVNGSFEKLDAQGRAEGWHWVAQAAVRSEGTNRWLEIRSYGAITQTVAVEPDWQRVKVTMRLRVTDVRRGEEGWKNARLAMEWRDEAGKHVDPWPNVLWAEGTAGWQTYARTFDVPPGAKTLHVGVANFGLEGGKAEYDNVSIKLVRKRATSKQDVPAPAGYEGGRAWDLADAWQASSGTRQTLCLNGLWQFLPVPDGQADAAPKPPAAGEGWGWFKVPGIWPRSLNDPAQDILLSGWWEDRTDPEKLDQAWCGRTVRTPGGWADRRTFIELTMLQTHARVFLDGQEAGSLFFPGGRVELTKLLRPGTDQRLDVLVTARPLAKETTAFMAPDRALTSKAAVKLRGLTGDVYLSAEPPGETIDDVEIVTSVARKELTVRAAIGTPGQGKRVLRARVLDGEEPVRDFASAPFDAGDSARLAAGWPDARLWDTHTPQNVYRLVLRLEDADGKLLDETLPIRFAFRELRVDGRNLLLNGTPIHLRALFLQNINKDADLANEDACRRTCRRMKEYGFNFLITANYHFQPGAVGYLDGLLNAADAEGVLCSVSLPHITDFNNKLDDPAQARRYRELCQWIIRRVRNHPSAVMYAMNHNACGYMGDQNPLKIDGIYRPEDHDALSAWGKRNRAQARIAESIARGLDATRPIYHHQSGNLGDLYSLNIYLNWAPMQERSDWLEHWATKGAKPLFFVEWGLPHISSWSSYRGPNFIWRSDEYQSIWDAEYNAEHLGDEAYELNEARIRTRKWEEELWATGKPFHWGWLTRYFNSDEQDHIRVKAMFADDNWRCMRAWGISAILPWDQETLWKKAASWRGGARAMSYEPASLKRPGIAAARSAPSESWLYHPQAEQIAPTVLGKSFLRWNRPLCGFIGGGESFTDKARNYLASETLGKQLVVINDTRLEATCRYEWRVGPQRGEGTARVAPGQRACVPVRAALRGVEADQSSVEATFDFGGGEVQKDTFRFEIVPEPKPMEGPPVALFDPKGMTKKVLDRLGAKYTDVDADADLSKFQALVIGREAIELANRIPDVSRVPKGLNVLIFEQTADVLSQRLGFRVNVHGLRRAFRRVQSAGPLIPSSLMQDWRGSSTLVPAHLDIHEPENTNPQWDWCGFRNTRVWRCGNRGTVASVLIEKPPVGDFRPLVDGGFDLQYAPLLEYVEGGGRVIFCQLDVTGRTEADPAALLVCRAMLGHANRPARPGRVRDVYHAGGERGAELLRALGVPLRPYAGQPPRPDDMLVVTPGGKLDDPAASLKGWRSTFALGLSADEVRRLWSGAVKTYPCRSYGKTDVPFCDPPDTEHLSPAERHWRTELAFDALSKEGDFHAAAEGAVFCQVAPWIFDCKAKPYLRTTYRRNLFLVSRILHNLGAPAKTPLLARLAQPAGRTRLDLPATWKAQADPNDVGRKAEWFKGDFDDSKWPTIQVPGAFDEQLPGLTAAYNGLCWHRAAFRLPKDMTREGLTLRLGAVDDESWVWLNGRFLGEVTKKTNPKDYYAFPRVYALQPEWLNFDGPNVLVVLVNDTYLSGGIMGKPQIAAPGAWLGTYYVQEPIADDDPYRYYRW